MRCQPLEGLPEINLIEQQRAESKESKESKVDPAVGNRSYTYAT